MMLSGLLTSKQIIIIPLYEQLVDLCITFNILYDVFVIC